MKFENDESLKEFNDLDLDILDIDESEIVSTTVASSGSSGGSSCSSSCCGSSSCCA